ncbi:MAG: DEAD/DEAH box helicase [Nanoarchaeota archaeon]
MIKDFSPRLYQETIFANSISQNTLIVLPTGLGKTNIFLMIAAHRLKLYPKSKILFLGPTRPLINQYFEVFSKYFEIEKEKMCILTGMVKPQKRIELWNNSTIIFSTPQGLENDIISEKIKLDNVSLLGIDEAHRAVGDYSYVYIAKNYHEKSMYELIIALTASPGSDIEKIEEVIKNLYIENIEAKSDDDLDVKEYIKKVSTTWIGVDFPDKLNRIYTYLKECLKSKLLLIKEQGFLDVININNVSRREMLLIQATLQGELARGNKDFSVLKSLSYAAEAMKIQHAIELIETQGLYSLKLYLESIIEQSYKTKTKAILNLVNDINFKSALILSQKINADGFLHPKISKLIEILENKITNKNKKAIIFTQFRDTGKNLAEILNKNKNIKAELFVGQAKKNNNTGLTQKKQIELINDFKENKFNVLISSSVGEEGLDVPQVDLVVFYEPIPSAIRHIQRRGRTGRQESGEVIILFTKKTRDEIYRWAAPRKEKKMFSLIEKVKKKIQFKLIDNGFNSKFNYNNVNNKLTNYLTDNQHLTENEDEIKETRILIYADYREKGNKIIKELINNKIQIKLEKLEYGDYLLSDDCCVEFKTKIDFVDSILDGRLLEQVKNLKFRYNKPIIILQGEEDLYSLRNIHPNAIRGMIATITVSFNVPIIYTKNNIDTSLMLMFIAKKEQTNNDKEFMPHFEKNITSNKATQEYIISSFPGIGGLLSKSILKEFNTIKNFVNSDIDKLKNVEKIGNKKAKQIIDIINNSYKDN